jgi:P-type Ca2+ transporter type 2C
LTEEPPRLLAETRRLVRLFGAGAAFICVGAVVLYGLLRGDWLTGVLAGIALAMSMLPEEFPVVLTVFTAMGAWRISKARVLTRKAATIESLGAATVLCTDKTGTLTENRMSVAALELPTGEHWQPATNPACPSNAMKRLALYGRLASDRQPYDPMELAFHDLGKRLAPDQEGQLVQTYGLRPELMAMTQVWKTPEADTLLAATKGAPEVVMELCRVATDERARILANADRMAQDGLRVLAIASGAIAPAGLPETQRELPLVFMGLVGLADPLRAGVFEAISEARAAGIRVVMITGDYPVTARAIARQAGLDASTVLTGENLKQMDDQAFSASVRNTSIFARITPDQKLRIVDALKGSGEVVAMTGDGVNDAPSLKASHIGIAMGKRGTDVAREASSLVLLDDDFGSIIHAIRLGRRIHDNLRKAMCFIVAVHVPVAGLALLPLLFGMPAILAPIHIALLELVIDPICSLVFENESEEKDIMRRPPMPPKAPLLSLPLMVWGVAQGLVILGLIILALLPQRGLNIGETRAFVFLSLVLLILGLTIANRSFKASLTSAFRRPNPILAAVMGLVLLVLGTTYLWPWAMRMLNFEPLGILQVSEAVGLAGIGLVILEGLKFFWRKALTA